jgi:gamma-glutamyltranspeptidase/glutathione hydrolase
MNAEKRKSSPSAVVATENQQAAEAGREILLRGGNAVDAACATALALGVVSPDSSGIGGGGFMLLYMAREARFHALDFRERAPLGASPELYTEAARDNPGVSRAGALAVAVPGEVAGLAEALGALGRMKFSAVAEPAIRLARNGFRCSAHLARDIGRTAPLLANDRMLSRHLMGDAGQPPKPDERLQSHALGATLARLGDQPVEVFYRGPLAREIASFVKSRGGLLTVDDFAEYRPLWRDPLRGAYRGHEVVTLPLPASGATLLEMLAMVEADELREMGHNSAACLAHIAEVMRQGFADRAMLGDPAFAPNETSRMLLPGHVNEARARALARERSAPVAKPRGRGTSSLCVVDKDRNIALLTTTINTEFGAKLMVPEWGILLNNSMDDFTVVPGMPNAARLAGGAANDIRGGKRPLSSIAPAILMRGGEPVLCLGGSGGPTIITGVFQTVANVLDFGLDPPSAVAVARIHAQGSPDLVLVESGIPEPTCRVLEEMGYRLRGVPALRMAISAVGLAPDALTGAADPRKGGGVAAA